MPCCPPGLLTPRRRPRSPLFPYTTLFRSAAELKRAFDQSGLDVIVARSGRNVAYLSGMLFPGTDRKSIRLNSSHVERSYAVFCLKKKTEVALAISEQPVLALHLLACLLRV